MRAHLKYLRYVLLHKLRVFQAGLRTGAPLWRLIVHDLSKFRPSEWGPYTGFFYGPSVDKWAERSKENLRALGPAVGPYVDAIARRERQRRQVAFDRAWLLHQHRNPHHWQYWILRNDNGQTKVLDMPEPFVREMVADWIGAGWVIRSDKSFADAVRGTIAWWREARPRQMLSPATERWVSTILDLLCRRFGVDAAAVSAGGPT